MKIRKLINPTWLLLVLANSLLAYIVILAFLSYNPPPYLHLGIWCGIISWVIFYSLLDTYLNSKGYHKYSDSLKLSAKLVFFCQIFSPMTFTIGPKQPEIFQYLDFGNFPFVSFFQTLASGGILSTIVFILSILLFSLSVFTKKLRSIQKSND